MVLRVARANVFIAITPLLGFSSTSLCFDTRAKCGLQIDTEMRDTGRGDMGNGLMVSDESG